MTSLTIVQQNAAKKRKMLIKRRMGRGASRQIKWVTCH